VVDIELTEFVVRLAAMLLLWFIV